MGILKELAINIVLVVLVAIAALTPILFDQLYYLEIFEPALREYLPVLLAVMSISVGIPALYGFAQRWRMRRNRREEEIKNKLHDGERQFFEEIEQAFRYIAAEKIYGNKSGGYTQYDST